MIRSTNGRFARGTALIYAIVAITALFAFVSLAVDLGRVQVAKTELQRAADAAARYATTGLGDNSATSKAITAAAENSVDGSPLVLTNSDIVVGTWSGGTFTSGGASPNAVKITAQRSSARNTGIPLLFGRVIGLPACDVHATVVATKGQQMGIIGFGSMAIHQNLFIASYNSSVTTAPSHSNYNSNVSLQSNGTIGTGAAGSSNLIYGNVVLGPSGSVNTSNLTVNGMTTTLGSNIPAPSAVTFTPVTNPGGITATPTVSGNTTWQAGTYYFTSFSMSNSATLNFSGPATIYLNGNGSMGNNDKIIAYANRPANLMVYVASGKSFTVHDDDEITARFQGPSASFTAHDDFIFKGDMIFQSITLHDRCDLYYDESLGVPGGTTGASSTLTVQ